MYVGLVVVLGMALVIAVSAVAGLVNGILHRADGASVPAAMRAGGRAGLAVLGVLIAVAGVVVAALGVMAALSGP